jgi:hypothetical protein
MLLLNDHLLKSAAPGWLTGKLSDVAGLVFFPLLLQGIWEVSASLLVARPRPSVVVLIAAVATTGALFAAVESWPPADEAYEIAMALARWPLDALIGSAAGVATPPPVRVSATSDPTDLLALPFLAIPLLLGAQRARRS